MEREGEWAGAYTLVLEARPLFELGPSWATLCGALASGGLTFDLRAIILLALSILLADALLGGIWAQSMAVAKTPSPSRSVSQRAARLFWPYTLPGSLGHRGLLWLQRTWAQWRALPARLRGTWVGISVGILFSLSLASALGPAATLVMLAALILLAVEVVRQRRGWPASSALNMTLRGAVPWLLGYAALGAPAWQSLSSLLGGVHLQALLWSGVYALAMYAQHRFEGGELQAGRRTLNTAHWVGIAALVAAREPVWGGIAALLYLPQGLLQATTARRRDGSWYGRHAQPYAMAFMLVGALSLAL